MAGLMRRDDAGSEQFERIKRQLQDSILSEYPNPERKGCPGADVVERLARRPLDQQIEEDPQWHHVTHCSECYREFLGFRAAAKQQTRPRLHRVGWGLTAAAAVTTLGVVFLNHPAWISPTRPQNTEPAYAKREVHVEAMNRSGEASKGSPPIELKREHEELTIQLPVGSAAGKYEFQLRQDARRVFVAHADATIHDGTTAFTVRVDLSRLDPGRYAIYIRQVPWDWGYYPVAIR